MQCGGRLRSGLAALRPVAPLILIVPALLLGCGGGGGGGGGGGSTPPPGAPSGLIASALTSSQINLAWTDQSSDETGFRVHRSEDGILFSQAAVVGAGVTAHTDSGLSGATLYYYRVTAYNGGGGSANSNTASATTPAAPPSPPSAPSGLSATTLSDSEIDLSWTDNSSNEDGFRVERSLDGIVFVQIADLGVGAIACSDSGLSASTTYTYRVRAYNTAGSSAYSATAAATTSAPSAGTPTAPSGLGATAVPGWHVDLAWTDNSADETGFRIERSTDGVAFAELTVTSANATSHSDLTATSPLTYTYRVRATNGSGDSAASNTASASIPGTWSNPSPSGPSEPTGRFDHTAMYDGAGGRMIVFGGYDGANLDDLWALSLGASPAWSALSPTGPTPAARTGHTAFLYGTKMILYGGDDGSGALDDVHQLSLTGGTSWSKVNPSGTAPARSGHTAILDAANARMIVFGGVSGATYFNDVHQLTLSGAGSPAWSTLSPSGTAPSARASHTAVYDAANGRMIVFGGHQPGPTYYNDVWELTLGASPAWNQLSPTGTPPTIRAGHSAVWTGSEMIVFGGTSTTTMLVNTMHRLTFSGGPAWSSVTPSGTFPSARQSHTAVWTGTEMVIFSGFAGSIATMTPDVYRLQ